MVMVKVADSGGSGGGGGGALPTAWSHEDISLSFQYRKEKTDITCPRMICLVNNLEDQRNEERRVERRGPNLDNDKEPFAKNRDRKRKPSGRQRSGADVTSTKV
ncbi:hypothetical protein PV326_005471 [Microctonus aethiopoides]|nr:hypothetical protein PV326_005471 [Microctonus aethiopoides]